MMRLSTIELMRLTRIELCDLATNITKALPDYPETSEGYVNAHLTLRNIRRVLARSRHRVGRGRLPPPGAMPSTAVAFRPQAGGGQP